MEPIVIYPKQAIVSNVQDVVFDYLKGSPLELSWTGFGVSYNLAVRRSEVEGEIEFMDLGEITQPRYSYSPVQEGETYEFRFITKDKDGKMTVPEVWGYTIPVDEPAPVNVKLERLTLSAVKISWEGDKEKNYLIIYAPANEEEERIKKVLVKGNSAVIEGLYPDLVYDFIIAKKVKNYLIFYRESLLQA